MTEIVPVQSDSFLAVATHMLTVKYPDGGGITNISLNFGTGRTAIVGNNGAGKSTLLETVAGLREPSSGNVELFGRTPRFWRTEGVHQVAIALQDGRPYPSARPQAFLQYLRELYATGRNHESERDVNVLLDAFALRTKTMIKNLSGGELQRLKCAAALIADTPILILDEPTAGLDPQGRRDLYGLLSSVVPANRTTLISTHILEDLESIGGRVIALAKGTVVFDSDSNPVTSAFHMSFASRVNLQLEPLCNALAEDVTIVERAQGRYQVSSENPIDAALISTVMNFCAQIGAEVTEVNVSERGGVLAQVEGLLLQGGDS